MAIIFGAVRQVIAEVGTLGTELFEIREAADRAAGDAENNHQD